jgi:ATP-dependent Clp protease adapter protein ClpS
MDRNTHVLLIHNDNIHSQDHFKAAIKRIITGVTDKALECMIKLIHYEGSAICAKDSLERVEHYQQQFIRYGIKTSIEVRLLK